MAVFQLLQNNPSLNDKLTILATAGSNAGNICLTTVVGTGSNSHDFIFIFLTISSIWLSVIGWNFWCFGTSFTSDWYWGIPANCFLIVQILSLKNVANELARSSHSDSGNGLSTHLVARLVTSLCSCLLSLLQS